MFNPMTPAEVVTALGGAARTAGRSQEPASDFSRGQLMSAYSASRHLSVELAEFEPELRAFADAMAQRFEQAPASVDADRFALRAAELRRTAQAAPIGDLIASALEDLRTASDPEAVELRTAVYNAVRALSDREVALLADVIEAKRR
jgi:hypothetical protein